MTQSLESFFAGGGGKSVSWKDQPLGVSVSGTIKAIHPPQQVTDPVDGKPKFNRGGQPVMQVRVDLATNFRNFELCKRPENPTEQDDGSRALYVGGWMSGAVGDALRKAGREGPPEVGGQLTVQLTERTPNDNPALAAINKFVAAYVSPAAQATGQFFQQPQQYAQQPPPFVAPQPVAPAITNGGYPAASPIQAPIPQQQPVAPVPVQPQYAPAAPVAVQAPPMQTPVASGPPRPAAIGEAAWNQMDENTRRSVAASLGEPPF